jgi:glycosyltransferase involved in cell wall biosynthesis
VFVPSLRMGGAERWMVELAARLAARGWAVDLVVPAANGALACEVSSSVNLIALGGSRMVTAFPRLAAYVRRARPAVVLASVTHAALAALAAASLARNATQVVVVEQSTPSRMAAHSVRRRDRVALRLLPRLYSRAAAVVAVSQGVATDVGGLSPRLAGRICVIPNGVDEARITRAAADPVEHEWFRPDEPPVLLAVGRLGSEKDFATLLRAFRLVRRSRQVRLLILGEGPERAALERLVTQLGLSADVALPGIDTNPYRYMARSAVFVLPSRVEGMPTVLIEALAAGTPVVSTDCESGPREILDGGRFGRLVPVGDVSALAEAICRTLDAPPARPPAEAWQRYDAERMAERYHDLVSEVVRETSRQRRS